MDMGLVETLVLAAHVLAALAIIGLVLIQQGRGADMGSGFGAGASSTVFGSGGAGNFLTKMTSTIAFAFFLSSFGLAFFAKENPGGRDSSMRSRRPGQSSSCVMCWAWL